MRHFITLSACALLMTGATLSAQLRNPNGPPAGWLHDFAAAQQQAKLHNRPILLHIYGSRCPPCKVMEATVLNTPEVLDMVANRFVGVKVDGQANRWLMEKYGVNSFPTDLVLTPEGKLVARSVGLQEKNNYVVSLSKFAPRNDTAIVQTEPPVTEKPIAPPQKIPQPTRKAELTARAAPKPGALPPDVGMEGFCPVTLWKTRTWKPGRQEFACDYEGQTYFFAGPEQLAIFKQNPYRYAPRILGCDPVLLTDNNDVIPGTTKFGAYYEGALYLFKNGDTRKRFRDDPEQYIRIQQVKLDPTSIQR